MEASVVQRSTFGFYLVVISIPSPMGTRPLLKIILLQEKWSSNSISISYEKVEHFHMDKIIVKSVRTDCSSQKIFDCPRIYIFNDR